MSALCFLYNLVYMPHSIIVLWFLCLNSDEGGLRCSVNQWNVSFPVASETADLTLSQWINEYMGLNNSVYHSYVFCRHQRTHYSLVKPDAELMMSDQPHGGRPLHCYCCCRWPDITPWLRTPLTGTSRLEQSTCVHSCWTRHHAFQERHTFFSYLIY